MEARASRVVMLDMIVLCRAVAIARMPKSQLKNRPPLFILSAQRTAKVNTTFHSQNSNAGIRVTNRSVSSFTRYIGGPKSNRPVVLLYPNYTYVTIHYTV